MSKKSGMTNPSEPKNKQASAPAPEAPPVIIYQNPAFVSGLLQALHGEGLIESAEVEQTGGTNQSSSVSWDGKAGAGGKVTIPAIGEASLSGDVQRVGENTSTSGSASARKLRYGFSEAHYFHVLSRSLRASNQVVSVASRATAESLGVGDIVEFTVHAFSANEINAVLDVATPELVATATRFTMLRRNTIELREIDDFEAIKPHRKIGLLAADDAAELGGAVAAALRRDFRSEATREFYGQVRLNDTSQPDGVITAITVCEAAHFVTEDPDRLLDGQFTVLGKVVAPLRDEVPILARNKLLDRIQPDFLKSLLENVEAAAESTSEKATAGSFDGSGIDLTFSSSVEGSAFSVLPIAIYV